MPLRVVSADADIAIAVSGALMVINSRGSQTKASLDVLETTQTQLEQTYGKLMSIVVMTAAMKQGDEEVRKKALEMTLRHEKHTIASAFVVATRGLSGVVVRTFLSGYFMFSTTSLPQKVFNNLTEALDWLRSFEGAPEAVRDATLEQQITDFLAG